MPNEQKPNRVQSMDATRAVWTSLSPADQRLIAAAPELLAMVKTLIAHLAPLSPIAQEARKLLNRIEGR